MRAKLRRLRREIEGRVPERGAGKRFPAELRHAAVSVLAEAQAEGIPGAEVARALGVRITTLRRWASTLSATAPACFKEVAVVDEVGPAMQAVVVLPNRIRIEGLDLDGVVRLLERLG